MFIFQLPAIIFFLAIVLFSFFVCIDPIKNKEVRSSLHLNLRNILFIVRCCYTRKLFSF
nr:MAG TPA: hypothetical protein [Caudoviricetes sp.]